MNGLKLYYSCINCVDLESHQVLWDNCNMFKSEELKYADLKVTNIIDFLDSLQIFWTFYNCWNQDWPSFRLWVNSVQKLSHYSIAGAGTFEGKEKIIVFGIQQNSLQIRI